MTVKAAHLCVLPLLDAEKATALVTWAYPVFEVVAQHVYPPESIRKEADDIARKILGIHNRSLTDGITRQAK